LLIPTGFFAVPTHHHAPLPGKGGDTVAVRVLGHIDRGSDGYGLDVFAGCAFEKMVRTHPARHQVNRSGLPDLIQFWPHEKRYRMIEVKGPGDRLQDNQIRWLDYCVAHNMPVAVCYVQWIQHGE